MGRAGLRRAGSRLDAHNTHGRQKTRPTWRFSQAPRPDFRARRPVCSSAADRLSRRHHGGGRPMAQPQDANMQKGKAHCAQGGDKSISVGYKLPHQDTPTGRCSRGAAQVWEETGISPGQHAVAGTVRQRPADNQINRSEARLAPCFFLLCLLSSHLVELGLLGRASAEAGNGTATGYWPGPRPFAAATDVRSPPPPRPAPASARGSRRATESVPPPRGRRRFPPSGRTGSRRRTRAGPAPRRDARP